jgi:PhzF family phenazine biosynthesis protein
MEHNTTTEVHIINAFVDNNQGGNPAGVVLNADHLNNAQKLAIAKKVGLSETAFVSQSMISDFKLDFFTPTRQIVHCGHATIATFSYLSQSNLILNPHSSKETIEGTREILMLGELAFMEQKAPIYKDIPDYYEKILKSLHLTADDLMHDASISLVNTGNSFVIVPIKDGNTLKNINPDHNLIEEISEDLNLIGFYAFSTETSKPDRVATTRMFAPRYGIEEEAATGMAAGPLACYLFNKMGQNKNKRILIEQGHFMKQPSPSLIIVDLTIDSSGDLIKVMAGGKGIVTGHKTV